MKKGRKHEMIPLSLLENANAQSVTSLEQYARLLF